MSEEETISTASLSPDYAAFVGLDWGDEKHALSLCAAGTTALERATLEQTPEALADWANTLRLRFPDCKIAIALEQARGALLAGLSQYEHIVLYPVNPKSLARFREALHPSRSKDDPLDADLLLELLSKHRDHLRPWQPDTRGSWDLIRRASPLGCSALPGRQSTVRRRARPCEFIRESANSVFPQRHQHAPPRRLFVPSCPVLPGEEGGGGSRWQGESRRDGFGGAEFFCKMRGAFSPHGNSTSR